ncbi:MAG: hypothetical protein ACRDP8_08820 [Actinopolymorphaceae bacterium]
MTTTCAGRSKKRRWSALCTETVLDGIYAIHDVPLPAGARRLAYLSHVPLGMGFGR